MSLTFNSKNRPLKVIRLVYVLPLLASLEETPKKREFGRFFLFEFVQRHLCVTRPKF